MNLTPEQVMDKKKLAGLIHNTYDLAMELLAKDNLEAADFRKLKVIKTITPMIRAGVDMIQQENYQIRNLLIQERMKQLGYEPLKILLTEEEKEKEEVG